MKIENYIQLKHLAISLLVVVSVTLLWLYLMNHISTNLLLFAEITTSLALIALLLPSSNDTGLFLVRLSVSSWILPVAVYVVAEAEILIFKHTGLGYVVALGLALLITALAEKKPAKKVAVATAIVGASLIPLYTLYAPSFGNDTWRDIMWAAQALQVGHVTETTIRQSAYPFPMVPLEYALTSLLSGLDPVWVSVVTGFLYLLQLPLVVFLLSRRFGGFDDFRGAFVLLMAPLAVIWSAWYIPQVYSLTLFLTAFLAGSAPTQIPLLAAGVFGHGGVATWMVLTTAALWISRRRRETAAMFFNLIIIFAAYVSYTSLLYALSGAYNSVVEAVLAFLRGEKILAATAPVSAPPTSSLGSLALSVLAVSGLLVFLHGRGSARTLVFLSGTFLIVAYVGASAFPAADLPRYLGLPSAAMLAVFAPYAFELLRRRRYGALYSLILVGVAVFSFAYSGVFAPKNPYTNNPYGLSLSGLISYGDAQQICTLSQMLAPGTYLTDWRSGIFIASTYLDIQPRYQGFGYRGIEFIYGGSYGLYIDSAYLRRFSGVIILRQESSNMPGVYSPDVFVVAKNSGNSIFYSSNDVTIWTR
jgi:hypothetical protein